MQRIQNTAARLITDTKKFESISCTLFELHWLRVHYRIRFKILVITFKAIYGMVPRYLSNLVSVKSSFAYLLRSNDTLYLDRPSEAMCPTLSARSFYAAAPALWNCNLPARYPGDQIH